MLISHIARHARNLEVNPQVSIMMIEDETEAKQLFARKRLTFDAVASMVERDSELWCQVIAQMVSALAKSLMVSVNCKTSCYSVYSQSRFIREGFWPSLPSFWR